jgi:hypothetical protein
VVLHVLSRAVFGELQGTRAVLGAWREWLGTGLFMALTLGRVDTGRSFNLPVRQLEGQAGREGRERRGVLGRRVGGYATWLTFVCFALEAVVLWSSFGLLAEMFLPAKADEGKSLAEALFGVGDEQASLFSWDDAFAYPLAVLLLEPFYVAAGFALYLNRRTLLEGWDIEVALRRIAERHAPALLLVLLSLVLLFRPFFPGELLAQEKDPKKEVAQVLQAPEFGHYREIMRWQPREPGKPKDEAPADRTAWHAIGYALAKAGEVFLWGVAVAVLGYALWWLARQLPRAASTARDAYKPPPALFGIELAPETLPADVPRAAAELAAAGRLREALSLLYRGALLELVHKRGVQLLASHTEGEAVRMADMPYFASLVDAWRRCAYARRTPSSEEIQSLATAYQAAFG